MLWRNYRDGRNSSTETHTINSTFHSPPAGLMLKGSIRHILLNSSLEIYINSNIGPMMLWIQSHSHLGWN